MTKPREFLLGESINGWYIKELGTKDFEPTTFLDAHCLRVKEVILEREAAIEKMVEALESINNGPADNIFSKYEFVNEALKTWQEAN